jgi:hypothetical protein
MILSLARREAMPACAKIFCNRTTGSIADGGWRIEEGGWRLEDC